MKTALFNKLLTIWLCLIFIFGPSIQAHANWKAKFNEIARGGTRVDCNVHKLPTPVRDDALAVQRHIDNQAVEARRLEAAAEQKRLAEQKRIEQAKRQQQKVTEQEQAAARQRNEQQFAQEKKAEQERFLEARRQRWLDYLNKIDGTPQISLRTPGHGFRTYREAIKEAKKPTVTTVHLDHGYNRALNLPPKTISSNRRPDVISVYEDGQVKRVEVKSQTDNRQNLFDRNLALDQQLRARGFRPLNPVVVEPVTTN